MKVKFFILTLGSCIFWSKYPKNGAIPVPVPIQRRLYGSLIGLKVDGYNQYLNLCQPEKICDSRS